MAQDEKRVINEGARDEASPESLVKAARIERWQEENRESFAAYDKRIEAKGVFCAGKRRF